MPNLRYKVAELADSRILAIEKLTRRAMILTPRPAKGEYRLSRRGALTADSGTLLTIKSPASCTGYQLELLPNGDARVQRPSNYSWAFTIRRPSSPLSPGESARFAILDLLGGGLLLARPSGVFHLTAAPAADGLYRTRIGSAIPVHRGLADPDFELADDFAP